MTALWHFACLRPSQQDEVIRLVACGHDALRIVELAGLLLDRVREVLEERETRV